MKIDVKFIVFPRGTPIPADHGFPIYSAISRILPELHQRENFGIHPITGLQTGDRMMILTDKSRLSIRIDSEQIGDFLPLAGKSLGLGRTFLQIGVPTVHPLLPSPLLRSRLVSIKGFMKEEEFIEAVRRQLDALNISSQASIHIIKERTLKIHDKNVIGFDVILTGLSDEESIWIQEEGLGGRRKMGCGLFHPISDTQAAAFFASVKKGEQKDG